jgi:hypothetical protein
MADCAPAGHSGQQDRPTDRKMRVILCVLCLGKALRGNHNVREIFRESIHLPGGWQARHNTFSSYGYLGGVAGFSGLYLENFAEGGSDCIGDPGN